MKLQNPFALFTKSTQTLLRQSALATLAALLLLMAFPPFELAGAAWMAMIPLLFVLTDTTLSLPRASWLGWLTGLLFTYFAENWIAYSMTNYGAMLGVLAYGIAFLFAAILALFPALFACLQTWLIRRLGLWALAFAPALWTATEYLRPLITGVTWNALGISQVKFFFIARLAKFGGVYLISALLVASSAFVTILLKSRERAPWRAAAALLLFGALSFWLPLMAGQASQIIPTTPVNVLGVQPNIPVDTNFDDTERYLLKTLALTRDAVAQSKAQTPSPNPDLIIWAECPLSLFYENDEPTRARLNQFAQEMNAHLIVNTVTRDNQNNYFNSVSTISPRPLDNAQPLKRYDKIRLVPFGEYVPLRWLLGRLVPAITGDFTPGRTAVVNTLPLATQRMVSDDTTNSTAAIERTTTYLKTGAFICYEAAYPALVRQFVQNGATLLINVSEDGWFGPTFGARQHLHHALMRAIENERDIVRVTNTGISALLTAEGEIVNPLPQFTDGTQRWQAQARTQRTFYTRYGDWFAVSCSGLSGLLLLIASRRKTKAA